MAHRVNQVSTEWSTWAYEFILVPAVLAIITASIMLLAMGAK